MRRKITNANAVVFSNKKIQQKKRSKRLCVWNVLDMNDRKVNTDLLRFRRVSGLCWKSSHPFCFCWLLCVNFSRWIFVDVFFSQKTNQKNPSVKIFIGDVRAQFQHGETLHDCGTIDMITNCHTNNKSTLKKRKSMFFFSTFATLNQPPFFRTVLYQGIRIAAHIHNPRPSNAWDFPPCLGRSNFQPSNCFVALPKINSLPPKMGHPKRKGSYSNHPFSGAMLVLGRVIFPLFSWMMSGFLLGTGEKDEKFFWKSPKLRTEKFKNMKIVKEKQNHLTNRWMCVLDHVSFFQETFVELN